MSSWYDDHIEEEIRDVVKLLRDNGINTESSCGHKMIIQFQVLPGVHLLYDVDQILCANGYKDYVICMQAARFEGHLYTQGEIRFEDLLGNPLTPRDSQHRKI